MEQFAPFYVGQEVVAIDNYDGDLIKDKIYIIHSILKDCCSWHVTVNILSASNFTRCTMCKRLAPHGMYRQFLYTRFKAIQEQEFKQVTFEKILEQMPVGAN